MYLWGEFDDGQPAPRELYGMGTHKEWETVGIPPFDRYVGSDSADDELHETFTLPPTRDEVTRIARAVEVDVGGTHTDKRKFIDWMKGS